MAKDNINDLAENQEVVWFKRKQRLLFIRNIRLQKDFVSLEYLYFFSIARAKNAFYITENVLVKGNLNKTKNS